MFEAPLNAQLEVHCGMMASSILSDTIPCERLSLHDNEVAQFAPPFLQSVKAEEETLEQPVENSAAVA